MHHAILLVRILWTRRSRRAFTRFSKARSGSTGGISSLRSGTDCQRPIWRSTNCGSARILTSLRISRTLPRHSRKSRPKKSRGECVRVKRPPLQPSLEKSNKHMQLQKHKIKYPVLEKVLHSAKEEFRLLQAAYSAEELRKHEECLATSSWDASFLPSIVQGARTRLAEKAKAL